LKQTVLSSISRKIQVILINMHMTPTPQLSVLHRLANNTVKPLFKQMSLRGLVGCHTQLRKTLMEEVENRDNMAGTIKIERKFFELGTLNGWSTVVYKTYKQQKLN
jgi:hypothetical protein